MKRVLTLTISLVLLTVSISLRAQGGYTFTPIFNGRFYATEKNATHARGIINGKFEPSAFDYYSESELKELVVVPVAYEDIRLVKVLYQNGYSSDQYSFNAVKDGTYTVYNAEGKKLLGPVSTPIGFHAEVLSLPYHLVATLSAEGQGYDLNILIPFFDPVNVCGPFEFAYYQEVKYGDKVYYVINAKKLGKEESAIFDVVGNPIPENRMSDIKDYYEKIGMGYLMKYDLARRDKKATEVEQAMNIYLAALCGEPSAVRVVIMGNYTIPYFDSEYAMLANHVQDAEALYYVGMAYFKGQGTDIFINAAKSSFQTADRLGDYLSKDALKEIAAIETPVKLATEPQAAVDEMMDLDILRDLAYKGNLEAIKIYCHQSLFFSFGSAFYNPEDCKYINDEHVIDVLPLLLAGAEKDANCQFMLACVYAGRQAMGELYPDYRYSFLNVEKAHYWINRFKSNPGRETAHCWGYSKDARDAIINNILSL